MNGGHIHKVCSLAHRTPRLALHAFFSILVSHDFFQPAILIKALRKNTHIAALWEPVNGGHIHKVCSLVHRTPRLALHAFFSILVSHDFFQPAILIKALRKNTRIAVLQESADIDIWRGGPLRPPDKFILNTSFFITLNPTPKT